VQQRPYPHDSASGPGDTLAIEPLLHPTEGPRLALAVGAAAIIILLFLIVLAAASVSALLIVLLFLGLVIGAVWVGIQIHRARLLGHAVQVNPDTLPELQTALDEVRGQLDYQRRIDVYVVGGLSELATLTSLLGTKQILLDGDMVADLQAGERRPQLAFLLGRFIGALKARHLRLGTTVLVLDQLRLLPLVRFFLLPYYRATVYSGDQIGLACCRDLSAALSLTLRLIVGKEVEPSIGTSGVIEQAALVSRRPLSQLAELFQSDPHLTNRYLNLLSFARTWDPAAFQSFRERLEDSARRQLDALQIPSQPAVVRPVPSSERPTWTLTRPAPERAAPPPAREEREAPTRPEAAPTPEPRAEEAPAAPPRAREDWEAPTGSPLATPRPETQAEPAAPPPAREEGEAPTGQPASTAAPGPARPPPGWYADPFELARLRWWDGNRWTERMSQ
jgi:Protein of unknown function (DUF2510)